MLKPLTRIQWSETHLAHLLNRAGFGRAPVEGAPATKEPPSAWVDRLLDVPTSLPSSEIPDWTNQPGLTVAEMRAFRALSEEERLKQRRQRQKEMRQEIASLKNWWLERILASHEPLQEKMTLFWHGHFVSSADKVRKSTLHWKQNNLFRFQGLGSFRDLTVAAGRDGAMLEYLDGSKSKKDAPNENYARELMELFTLGEGHYTEEDIKEAARAFTGWGINRRKEEVSFNPRQFDSGTKTFFGKTGNFNDEDIVDIILDQKQAARHLATKLWSYFAYANPEASIVDSLAATLKDHNYQIQPVLREIFLSQAFYSAKAMRTQIKSPVMWLASLNRLLDRNPFPGRVGNRIIASLGQELLQPPSVKGWDGGRSWISTTTLIARNNFAHFLIHGGRPAQAGLGARDISKIPEQVIENMTPREQQRLQNMGKRINRMQLPSFLRNESLAATWSELKARDRLPYLVKFVYQGPIPPTSYTALENNLSISAGSASSEQALKQSLYELVAQPEFQLT